MDSKCKPTKYITVQEYFDDKGKSFKEAVKALKKRSENFKENTRYLWDESLPIYNNKSLSVEQLSEKYKDYLQKGGALVSLVDEEKERGITIKPFAYNSEDLKDFDLGDTISDILHNHRIEFTKAVDFAIKEYFLYKYNRDIDELIRISKNVNNFKIKDRFYKVSNPLRDYYYDGDYCYLTTVQGFDGDATIQKHWLR